MPRQTYKKITTNDELISKINKKNIKTMESFLKEKNTRSGEATILNYRSDLLIFFTWVLQNCENKFFVDIKRLEFSEFFSYAVDELKWGSSRFAREKSVLSSFSNFIEKFFSDEYPLFRNVINKTIDSMPREKRREKTILSEKQVNNILNHFSGIGSHQLCCWFALAIASGSRFSELLRFTTDIIDEKNLVFDDIFIQTSKAIKTKGRTREGKMLKKYIIKDIFFPYYEQWLVFREDVMKNNNKKHNFIFIKKDGSPAEDYTARAWAKQIEEYINIPFYVHSLRHYGTTYLSKIGLPYNLIQEIYGWEDISMVSLYDDTEAIDKDWKELKGLKNALEKK